MDASRALALELDKASPEMTALLALVRAVAPPPRRTVSEWADAERWLDRADTAMPGPWRTDREPWQRELMDAIHEGAENIVVMKGGQVGVTECLLNTIGYHIVYNPCGMLLVEPTEALAKRLARRRLAFMIRATPALAKVVAAPRSRDASQTLLQKIFPGGSLILAGANSPTALASDPLRIVLFDERDKYPEHLGAEGDPVSLGMKRTETFWDRRHIHVSTPTMLGSSGIQIWFDQSDQRRFYVPCPHCGEAFVLRWSWVEFDAEDPTSARWRCPACKLVIPDRERLGMLARGQWRSTAEFHFRCPQCGEAVRLHRGEVGVPDAPLHCGACEYRIEVSELPRLAPVAPDRVIGFHVWSAMKSTIRLSGIVAGFLRSRRLGREAFREWINQTLGESFEDEPPIQPAGLLARLERYPDSPEGEARLPAGAVVLTAGVDTQDDRLEWRLWGWGAGEERWLIDIRTIPGDPDAPETWTMLNELRSQAWIHPSGHQLRADVVAIDSAGHKTDAVYEYVRLHQHERVYATIGRDGQRAIFTPGLRPPRSKGNRQEKRRVPLYIIGVDSAKSNWHAALKTEHLGPSYVHLPHHPAVEEEIEQLASERRVKRRGVERWEKIRAAVRNEGLDCAVLALWALRALAGGGTTEMLLRQRGERYQQVKPMAPPPAPEPVMPRRPNWLGRREGEWLRK